MSGDGRHDDLHARLFDVAASCRQHPRPALAGFRRRELGVLLDCVLELHSVQAVLGHLHQVVFVEESLGKIRKLSPHLLFRHRAGVRRPYVAALLVWQLVLDPPACLAGPRAEFDPWVVVPRHVYLVQPGV